MSSVQRSLYTLVAPALFMLALGCGGDGGGGDGDAAVSGSGGAGSGGSSGGGGSGAGGAGGAGNDASTGSGGATGAGGGSGGTTAGNGGAGGSAGAGASSLQFDDDGVTRTADTSQSYLLSASLVASSGNRVLTISAAQLNPNAAGMKGSFSIGLFKTDGPIVAGTPYTGCQVMFSASPAAADIWSSQGGSCSITLTMVPAVSGQRLVGTFTATLRALLGTNTKPITSGKFDVVAATVAGN